MDDPENQGAPAPKKAASQPAVPEKPSASWAIPLITAAIVASVFCLYYFVYVSARREYLTNRNFRALATLGDQLQTVVSIHGSILEYYADQTDPQRMKVDDRGKKPLQEFLLVQPEDQNLEPKEQKEEALRDYLKFYAPGFELSKPSDEPPKSSLRLDVLRRNGAWYAVFTASRHPGAKTEYTASRPLAELMQPLVASLPFDDILLVSQNGGIVYQKEKTGPQFTKLGDLLQTGTIAPQDKSSAGQSQAKGSETARERGKAAGEPDSIIRNADPVWASNPIHLSDIAITGSKYKLFIQPVLLNAFIDDPTDKEPPQEFVLCGLRSSKSLEWEALSISYNAIIWVTAIFFVVCLSGPVLKIAFMNHRERLRTREMAFLTVSLVLLAAVFTLCGLQAFPSTANDDTEEQLQALGERFQAKIVTELGNMRAQLIRWCASSELQDDLKSAENPAAQEHEIIRSKPGNARPLPTPAKKLPKPRDTPAPGEYLLARRDKTPAAGGGYPYLNNAFWTDDDGHQIVKWGLGPYVTPMIDVSQLPSYTNPRTTYLNDQPPPFHFGPVLPPNKLEYLAAMTMNTCECNPAFCPKTGAPPLRGDIANGATFLVSRPLSLIDPILPYGYGFALVDRSGLVLFHSDKTRNDSENFRQETDWNNELYAAMFGQSSNRSVLLNYKGRSFRARVFSIPASPEAPRSLIVYRDLTSVRTRNLEAVTMASTLYVFMLAVPIAILAVWWAIHRPRLVPEWLWPSQRGLSAYLYQIAALILLVLLFGLSAFRGAAEQIVIACFVVPYLALILTSWYFRFCVPRADPGMRAAEVRRSPAAVATLTALGGIVLLYALALVWPHRRVPALILGFGLIAAAPLLKKSRFHLWHRVDSWFAEKTSQQKDAHHVSPLLNFRAAFVAAAVLLLFLIGVLTPMALFQATQRLERRLGVKEAQLHLASSLAERLKTVLEECKGRDEKDAACADFKDKQGKAWQFIVPDLDPDRPPGPPRIETHQTPQCRELYSGLFQTVVYLLHHDYNDVSAETRGIITACSQANSGGNSPGWSWEETESAVTLRWHGVHSAEGGSPEDLVMNSAVPGSIGSDLLTGGEVAVAVTVLMGGLLWGLARRLFLFDVAPLRMTGPRQAAEALREGRNILVLVPPRFPDWEAEGAKCSLSIRETAKTGPKWAENLDLNPIPNATLLEIRHFEYGENDAETENQKSILLYRLLRREGTQVVAIMTAPPSSMDYRRRFPSLEVVDLREEPFYWLQKYDCPARDLIWKECRPLAALWPIGAQLAEDLGKNQQENETIEPDTVVSEILERADLYYRMIWKDCSIDERFVLTQLVEDGMLNPTNKRAIRQLARRGLIVADPQFRPMNESFRRFVRSAATADLKTRWHAESRQSGWGKTHGIFFTTMAAVGVFLLATQNALWQSSAAYVTTALGALGTLTKLFNTFRGGGPASTDKPS